MSIFLSRDNMIDQYTIYGERHSGTKLLKKIVDAYFRLQYSNQYGWKHFFGFYTDQLYQHANNIIFLCIVRNPYNWLAAMYDAPHHLNGWYDTRYRDIINPFSSMEEFLSSRIISYRTPNGMLEEDDRNFQEIITDRNLLTGKHYKNIFELRKIKLQYLYRLQHIAPNIIMVKYEDLLDDYMVLVNDISSKTGMVPIIDQKIIGIQQKTDYHIPDEIKAIIDENIDWSIESKFDYIKK